MSNLIPLCDFHMHTFYSGENNHAVGTIRDIVDAAREAGLTEILITDHGPGHYGYGIDKDRFLEIREEIDKLNDEFDDINILMGMETNVIGSKGEIDISDDDLKYFDRINVGYHYGVMPRDLGFFYSFLIINPLSKILPFLENYAIKLNTEALIKIVENNKIFTITHPGSKAKLDILKLAKVCEENGTALEINSSGHGKLSVEDIKIALQTNVMFTLGSDAHNPKRVGDLKNSIDRVKQAGLPLERIINKFK